MAKKDFSDVKSGYSSTAPAPKQTKVPKKQADAQSAKAFAERKKAEKDLGKY